LSGALALVVHRLGDQFLAASGFAADQDGAVRGGNFFDQFADLSHPRGFADESAFPFGPADAVFQRRKFAKVVAAFGDPAQTLGDFGESGRFHQVVDDLVSERVDRGILARVAGHHDRLHFGVHRFRTFDHLHPSHPRHVQVDQQAIVGLFL
jgi:hypothetical protein